MCESDLRIQKREKVREIEGEEWVIMRENGWTNWIKKRVKCRVQERKNEWEKDWAKRKKKKQVSQSEVEDEWKKKR